MTHADGGVLELASSSDDDAPMIPCGQAKQMECFVHFIGDRVAWNSQLPLTRKLLLMCRVLPQRNMLPQHKLLLLLSLL